MEHPKIKKNIIKDINAMVFFNAVIKKGEISLLADLKIITAILQHKAAINAAISPKYKLLVI